MIFDFVSIAWSNLKKRKLRSWLTVIGIVISIATIFTLISLSLGLQDAVSEQFRLLGTDKFFIQALGQLAGPGVGGAVQLETSDVDVIEKVSGVNEASYMAISVVKVEYLDEFRYTYTVGIPLDKLNIYNEIQNSKPDEGRLLEKGDRGRVVLGSDYKYGNLFKRPVRVGDEVILNGKAFKVQGIMTPIGNPGDDRNVVMSIEDFRELYNSGERVDQIFVQVDVGENLTQVAERVDRRLMSFRNVDEKTKDFVVSTPEELLGSFQAILNVITAFLFGVAAISLFVGGIGIANTMYTSVLERTREIGTMKAIGAKNKNIYLIFTLESGMIGFAGGVLGVLLGMIVSKIVSYVALQTIGSDLFRAAFPASLIIGCLLFAFIIGALAGSIPSWKASKLSPVDALRYE